MIRINKIITKLIKNVGIDKITHFFAGATISLSVTLILFFVCGLFKELCDLEFNKEDFLATMFGGSISIAISLISLL